MQEADGAPPVTTCDAFVRRFVAWSRSRENASPQHCPVMACGDTVIGMAWRGWQSLGAYRARTRWTGHQVMCSVCTSFRTSGTAGWADGSSTRCWKGPASRDSNA
ncbi:hypothetical protein [Streptomyces sp. Ac-502]|uniref:hypothetical protein n=1 Tax=Streptomyces sp. Ac-502 TaxID=3342801 RepID=UPI00386283E4